MCLSEVKGMQFNMEYRSLLKLKRIFIWLLIGVFFSFVMCSMCLSKHISLYKFYDVGKVYELRDIGYKTSSIQSGGHQENSGKVILDNGYFEYDIGIQAEKTGWNYFCIQLKNMSTPSINCIVSYEIWEGRTVVDRRKETFVLHKGINSLNISKKTFDVLHIKFWGDKKTSFYITDMQLRENKPVWDTQKAVLIWGESFLAYLFVLGIILYIWNRTKIKINLYCWIEILQSLYIMIIDQFQKISVCTSRDKRKKRYCRVLVFIIIFLYTVWIEMQDLYAAKFKYHVVFYSILILAIVVLSIESSVEKKKWNNSLVWGWLILWIMACISDFLIPKKLSFVGYVMIFVIGLYTFIWNNMKDPEEMIQDFACAIHVFFVFVCLFCLLFRPEMPEVRYSGISKNPGVFGLYLGTIWAVILGEIETQINAEVPLRKILPRILELCLVFSFSWKSQSACPLLCMFGVGLIWFIKNICLASKKEKQLLGMILLSTLIILFPSYKFLGVGLKYIPRTIGTPITYVNENPIAKNQFGMIVYAEDIGQKIHDSRIGHKFESTTLSGVLSGRNYYWRAYLRDMNLFGHKNYPKVWGYPRFPHNSLIGIAHRYGIFACIPYILMIISVVYRTFKYSRKKNRCVPVPFYVCVISIAMSMADNVEMPFLWLPWFGLYLMMGIAFDDGIINETGKEKR